MPQNKNKQSPNAAYQVPSIPRYLSTINQRIPGEYIGPDERSTVQNDLYWAPNNMMMTPEAVAYAQNPRNQRSYGRAANMWSDYMQSLPPSEDFAPMPGLMTVSPKNKLNVNKEYWQGQVMMDNPSEYVPGYGWTSTGQAAQLRAQPYVDPTMAVDDITAAAIEGRRRPNVGQLFAMPR